MEQPKKFRLPLSREDIKTIVQIVTVFILVALAYNVGMYQQAIVMKFCAEHGQAVASSLIPSVPNITAPMPANWTNVV